MTKSLNSDYGNGDVLDMLVKENVIIKDIHNYKQQYENEDVLNIA